MHACMHTHAICPQDLERGTARSKRAQDFTAGYVGWPGDFEGQASYRHVCRRTNKETALGGATMSQ